MRVTGMDSVDHSVAASENRLARVQVQIRGAVQGVGFRPFICRLARELHVGGWVRNSSAGIVIEAEACREKLQTFLRRLEQEKPVQSVLQSIDCQWLAGVGYEGFEIRSSDEQGSRTALVLTDLAT